MSNDLDICEQITHVSGDRAESWNFIRSFASHWVTPIEEGDGYTATELLSAEQQLGIPLPAALREAYSLFGRRSDLTRNQEYLLEPPSLYVDHGALIFRHENQGAAIWGILLSDIQNPDPPVYQCFCIVENVMDEWQPWLGRFSLACIDLILWESLYDSRMPTEFRDIGDDDFELVEQLYTELPGLDGPDSYTPVDIRWFTGPDILLCYTGSDLAVRARTREAISSIREKIPGDWLNE